MTPPPGQTAYRFRYALLALAIASLSFAVYWGGHSDNVVTFWLIFFSIVMTLQFIFLAPRKNWPIELTLKKRPARRSVLIASLAATILSLASFCTLTECIEFLSGDFNTSNISHGQTSPATQPSDQSTFWSILLSILSVVWVFWGIVFWLYLKKWDRYEGLYRLTRHLLVGTILQMFITIAARAIIPRKDCDCASSSFTGLILGFTVLAWVFGPAVILVFLHEKVRLARLEAPNLCHNCLYNLTGTRAAGGTACPECGHAIP